MSFSSWFVFKWFAQRFVAGETALEAVTAALRVNGRGMSAIIDFLGEDVFLETQAQAAVDEYLTLLRLIKERNVRAAVSLKVSQMGVLISKDVCAKNLERIAQEADRLGLFIWIDMEGSALTQKTIDAFDELRPRYKAVGLCLQAYLVRTGSDFDQLVRRPLNLRLCKGAYKEPPTVAYASKSAVNGNYRMLLQKTLDHTDRGIYPAFATHDREMIDYILDMTETKKVGKEQFEFQMLYGIQNHWLEALAEKGYRTNVYIPYGTHWLPYFIRRMRERKENVYFLLRNLLRL